MQGASADDEVWLFGSDRADVATIQGEQAHITSDGYDVRVSGVRRFSLLGQGGADSITVYDSSADDHFVGRREFLLFSGEDYRHLARGFEQIKVEGGHGGTDTVLLYDSPDNDQWIAAPNDVTLRSQQFSIQLHGFDEVTGSPPPGDSTQPSSLIRRATTSSSRLRIFPSSREWDSGTSPAVLTK